ncbi:MAG: hypothetical protein WBV85_05815 [Solirubrobacteraceae bacterium]
MGLRRYVRVPVLLCALVFGLTFTSVAFAAAPEAPETLSATQVSGMSATFNGELNPKAAGEAGQYEFLYKASETECAPEGSSAPSPPGPALGLEKEGVSVNVTGLSPGTKYTVCLLARNPAEEVTVGSAVTFTTSVVAPTIASEYTSQVIATSATLDAEVNPGGGDTTYHFDYGTTNTYGQSTPESTSIGADNGNHTASAPVQGLQPGTTYHYRVVATNSQSPAGGRLGSDRMITTPTVSGQLHGSSQSENCANEKLRAEQPYGLGLPDCRAYEMVSPIEKNDSDAISGPCVTTKWGSRGSVSGEAIAYNAQAFFADPAGTRFCSTYLSRRGPDGWSTENITPPHIALEEGLGSLNASPFKDMYFTPSLSEGIVTEQTVPLTGDTPTGLGEYFESVYLADFANGSYRLLQSLKTSVIPEDNDIPQTEPAAASTDLSHVLLQPESRFASPYPTEWVDGRTIPVNVGNNGESLSALIGSGPVAGLAEKYELSDTWHAMSSDGKRVFMTSISGFHDPAGRELLYVRENPEQPQSPMDGQGHCAVAVDACTVLISASRRTVPDPNGPYPVRFWGASANGSKVFFSSRLELTNDAYTGPTDNRPNLYEYNLENEQLKDLTVDKTDVNGAAVRGVVEISEDGSYVYFVAKGDLAEGATAGQANLYVSHDGGAPKFIAALADTKLHEEIEASGNEKQIRESIEETTGVGADVSDWFAGGPQENTAAVTMNGAKLAFLSERSLTDYDNERAENSTAIAGCGEENKCSEVYVYDAVKGSLTCVSCNPTGARPLGPSNFSTVVNGPSVQVRPRNFSEDGSRLFFQSYDALVPRDSNGHQDVYEYDDGLVYPVSNVAGDFNSQFLDAGANGDDVFIATADRLLAQDRDLRIDIYDARSGGGFPVNVVPSVCDNGDACKPSPTAQPGVFGAPASATFSGAGNIAPVVPVKAVVKLKAKPKKCKRGFVKKRGRCVRQKTRKSDNRLARGRK